MQTLPSHGIRQSDIDEYIRQTRAEIEYIRDFIVLHFHVTPRADSPFWRSGRLGQGTYPESHRPAADLMGGAELSGFLGDIKMQVDETVARPPAHQSYVEQYCKAADVPAAWDIS